MTDEADAQTGYDLTGVYGLEQHYDVLDSEDVEEERQTRISWDWQVTGEASFAVYLALIVIGPKTAPERVRVAYVASFEFSGSSPTLDLQNFVVFSASALLIPYLREAISSLSSDGPFGQMNLSPVNVQALMDFVDFEQSTGYQQLAEDPEMAETYGVDLGSGPETATE